MIRKTFVQVFAAVLSFGALQSASAAEILGRTEEALEIHLNFVEMPTNNSAPVIVNGCSGCRTVSKNVTPNTRYFVGRSELPLTEFRAAVAELQASHRGAETTLVGIFYNVESDLITRIIMLPARN